MTEGFRERSAALERTVMRDGRGRVLRTVEVGARMAPMARPALSREPTSWTCCGPTAVGCPSGWA